MENKYFTELAHRLQAAGITTGHPERNQLTVLLNDQPVLFVSSESDVFLLPAGSNPPEASELYHKVAQTAEEVYAYVEAIQTAPLLHASGLSEKFHLLADFGGAVLAGRELFYPQIGVKPCSMAGGGVSETIWNCLKTAPAGTGQPLTCSTSGMGLRLKWISMEMCRVLSLSMCSWTTISLIRRFRVAASSSVMSAYS